MIPYARRPAAPSRQACAVFHHRFLQTTRPTPGVADHGIPVSELCHHGFRSRDLFVRMYKENGLVDKEAATVWTPAWPHPGVAIDRHLTNPGRLPDRMPQ